MKINDETMWPIQLKIRKPGGLASSDSGLKRPASRTERYVFDKRFCWSRCLNDECQSQNEGEHDHKLPEVGQSHFFSPAKVTELPPVRTTVSRFTGCFVVVETIANTTVAVDDLPQGPTIVRLAAPVPNPLLNRSMFAFELPRAESVNLAIHDISGRRVRLLVHGALGAGRHQQLWDGTDDQGRAVVAGMYFARLEAGASHARTSVIVLR